MKKKITTQPGGKMTCIMSKVKRSHLPCLSRKRPRIQKEKREDSSPGESSYPPPKRKEKNIALRHSLKPSLLKEVLL
jgi:hypothetical protein